MTDLVTQPLDQHSEHPHLIHDPLSLAPLHYSQCHYHLLVPLHDYVYNQVTSPNRLLSPSSSSHKGTHFSIGNFVSYHHYSSQHYSFIVVIHPNVEQTSYAEAARNSHWQKAMQSELDALKVNNT